jgi:lycopene cyclase domain-containing protein
MKYLYLIINICTFLFPFALSFDKKVAFYKKWKYLTPALVLVALFFLIWDYFFTEWKVWGFNDAYITGVKLLGLPLEEILFFFTVPYACIFLYECLIVYLPKDYFKKAALPVTLVLIALLAVGLLFNYDKLYTACTIILTGAYLVQLLVVNRAKWLGRFYMGYLVALIPFLIVNGILTAKPVVIYNDAENMGIRLFSIPIEDPLYMMLLLLMNIAIYERLQKRFVPQPGEDEADAAITELTEPIEL